MNPKHISSLTAVLVGVVVGVIVCKWSGCSQPIKSRSAATSDPPFFLGVTITFGSAEDKKVFIENFRPLAEYVKAKEPETLSYELSESDKEPNQLFILERYKHKQSSYLEIHRHSKPFLVFREQLKQMMDDGRASLDGHSYIESGIGFV